MSRRLRPLLLTLAGIGFLGLVVMAILVAPPLFVPDDPELTLPELYRARNDVRTTLLQAVAGLVLLLGAYFTYRQVQNSTRALRHTQEQIEIARSGQVTERFTRAIEQLASDNLDIRLGGIYALERIARDSSDDRPSVAEVLCAYVREHSPWPPSRRGQYVENAPLGSIPSLGARAQDLQAILTVLGRGGFADDQRVQLDLSHTDLRAVELIEAGLQRADLRNASLFGGLLAGADLREADLAGTDLVGATLRDARLHRAILHNAELRTADLAGADLRDATLNGADLVRANLCKADLTGASIHDFWFPPAKLHEAIADDATRWPEGFNWRAAGVRLLEHTEVDAESEDQQA